MKEEITSINMGGICSVNSAASTGSGQGSGTHAWPPPWQGGEWTLGVQGLGHGLVTDTPHRNQGRPSTSCFERK